MNLSDILERVRVTKTLARCHSSVNEGECSGHGLGKCHKPEGCWALFALISSRVSFVVLEKKVEEEWSKISSGD